jgi:hypothetical protein
VGDGAEDLVEPFVPGGRVRGVAIAHEMTVLSRE